MKSGIMGQIAVLAALVLACVVMLFQNGTIRSSSELIDRQTLLIMKQDTVIRGLTKALQTDDEIIRVQEGTIKLWKAIAQARKGNKL